MAQPTPFDRQTSFAQYSANYPSRPHNGADIDAEFNAVKISLDETQQNLALIQDDDGALARGSVGQAQLDSSIILGFASPTPWAAATLYTVDISTVWYLGKFYSCLETHTSTVTFDATKWFQIADLSASAAIADGSITEAKLADAAVTASKIQSLAVSTSKIANNAVTLAKLGASVPQEIANLIIPVGIGPLPWPGATAPAGWVFTGATYSRATYPALWAFAAAEIAGGSTWFTVGDGSTNFTIASIAGRAVVGVDSGGSTLSGAATNGAATGAETKTIAQVNLPVVTLTSGVTSGGQTYAKPEPSTVGAAAATGGGVTQLWQGGNVNAAAQTTGTLNVQIPLGGSGTPLSVVQPVRAAKHIMFAGF